MMKNVIIVVLSILTLIFGVYAFVQQGIAKEKEKQSVEIAEMARRQAEDARKSQMAAAQAQEEAMRQAELAKQAFADCLKKKK